MNEKLQAVLDKVKSLASSAVSAAPLPVGIAIGYLGAPVIKLAINVVAGLVKGILG